MTAINVETNSAPLPPGDEYNRKLQENVHPGNWTNPTPNTTYQLVVIGAGTAGLVTAAGAAGLGARVALIERQRMGGDCLNVGCVPSKGIIAAARAFANVRSAGEFGVEGVANCPIDFPTAMQRMRRLRADISPVDSAARFQDLGVDVFFGRAEFADDQSVRVTGDDGVVQNMRFKKAVIATGARSAAPPIEGLSGVNFLTNETLFSLTELPPRMGIIGAGPIGVEMAQTFARFGSQVTLFERADRILSREDPQAAELVQAALSRDGVQLALGATEISVSDAPDKTICIKGIRNQSEFDTSVDQLLVAVGRAPNVEGLNLEAAGVTYHQRGVEVNDFLQTTNPKIFAAGDICSQFQFTHAADFQARIVIQNSLFALGPIGRRRMSQLHIPWATYTSPEIAHIGLTEEEAEVKQIAIDTFVQPMVDIDRAILDGSTEGFVKVLTSKGTDKILGATIVADQAGDMISQFSVAMTQKIGLSAIGASIFPYPTQADAIRKLGDQFNKTRLTPRSQRLLMGLMRMNVGK